MVATLICNHVKASINDKEKVENQTSNNSNVASEGQICEPNSLKMQECNRCRCSPNGLVWLCTRKACPKFKEISPNDPGFVCTPNKVFKYECNTCTCNSNGIGASCTELACDVRMTDTLVMRERKLQPIESTPTTTTSSDVPQKSEDQCVPGTRWKEDCNMCFCTSTGLAACTLRGCLGKVNLPTIKIDINHARRKRQAINQYKPTADIEKVYTFEDLNDPNFSCTPSLSFKVDCNTCWCAADGKRPRFCTRVACIPKVTSTTVKIENPFEVSGRF